MEFFEYRADILPAITLININKNPKPQRNIHRTSEDYIFYLMKSGEMYFKEDGKDYVLKKGETFLFEPGKEHFGTKDTEYSFYYIHFKHKYAKKVVLTDEEVKDRIKKNTISYEKTLGENKIIIPKRMNFLNTSVFSNLCNLCEKAINDNFLRLNNYETLTSCSANEIFIKAYRSFMFYSVSNKGRSFVGEHRINEVISFLNSNFKRKLTSEIIEHELSYNFDYLNQQFKKYVHTSIFKTLENIRMEEAKNILKNTDESVNFVAQEVGYEDGTYFSKAFKKASGYSPSVYREFTRKKNN